MIELVPMNNTVSCDPNVPDVSNRTTDNCSFTRRGRAFLLLPTSRSMIEDAFGGLDPRAAQRSPLAFRIVARHPRIHGQPMAIILVVELYN